MGIAESFLTGYGGIKDIKAKKKAASIDALMKQAQIEQAGYKAPADMFGGRVLERSEQFGSAPEGYIRDRGKLVSDKTYMSPKDKLDFERLSTENKNMKDWSGMYPSQGEMPTQTMTEPTKQPSQQFGATPDAPGQKFGSPGGSQEMYIMVPDPTTGRMKMVANPNRSKPMNELDKLKFGQLEQKIAGEKQIEESKESALRDRAEGMLSTIGEVRGGMDYFGPFGDVSSKITEAPHLLQGYDKFKEEYGDRRNWEINVQKLLSEKIVNLMAEMKAQSRTGATGFGQLNRSELRLLQEASTALKRDLNPEDAERYLNQIEALYQKVLDGGDGGGNQEQGQNIRSNRLLTEEEDVLGLGF